MWMGGGGSEARLGFFLGPALDADGDSERQIHVYGN